MDSIPLWNCCLRIGTVYIFFLYYLMSFLFKLFDPRMYFILLSIISFLIRRKKGGEMEKKNEAYFPLLNEHPI